MTTHANIDFHGDAFDTIDGKMWIYNSANPSSRREVVSLLDHCGEDTDDPENAAGGVVKIGDECFQIFWF